LVCEEVHARYVITMMAVKKRIAKILIVLHFVFLEPLKWTKFKQR